MSELSFAHDQSPFVTAAELARFLGVSAAAVRKWSRAPDFPVKRFGRSARYHKESVLAWFSAKQQKNNGNGKAETAEAVDRD